MNAKSAGRPRPGRRMRGVPLACLMVLFAAGAPAAAPLSLEECVAIARRDNPGLAGARMQVESAKGSYLSSYSSFLPSASAQVGFDRTTSKQGGGYRNILGIPVYLPPSAETRDSYSARYGISQNLVNPPDWFRHRASGADVMASRETFRASEADLVLAVRQQYFLLLKAILLEQVSNEALAVSEAQLRKSETLFELGSVAKTDVLQARVNRAAAERTEINARNAVEQERARLAVLMGMNVQEPLEIRLDVSDPPEAETDESTLIKEAGSQLPEVRRARAQVVGSSFRYRSASWSQFPTLGGDLSYSKQMGSLGDVLKPSEIDQNANWGVSVGFSWNVFDGMNTIGNKRSAKAALYSAREEHRRQELQAALGVREAQIAIRNAREGIRAAGESVNLAEENLKLQQALYENGGGTILEVNNAQSERTKAKNDLVTARVALHLALAQMDRAVGR